MRTTRKQIEGAFSMVVGAAQDRGIDTSDWTLDNVPEYGGYQVETRNGSDALGGVGHRLAPSAFYNALRLAEGILRA